VGCVKPMCVYTVVDTVKMRARMVETSGLCSGRGSGCDDVEGGYFRERGGVCGDCLESYDSCDFLCDFLCECRPAVGNTCLDDTCLDFLCGCVVGFEVYCVVLYSNYVGGYLWCNKYLDLEDDDDDDGRRMTTDDDDDG